MIDARAFDRQVRVAISDLIQANGAVPTAHDVAGHLKVPKEEVEAAFRRLADGRVHILRPGTNEILAFDPFAVGPTAFLVTSAGRRWWAICGWDALGVPAALHADGVVDTTCGDSGERLEVRIRGDRVEAAEGIVLQIGVPALDFWKDIVYT